MKDETGLIEEVTETLPPGWCWAKLDEICVFNPRRPLLNVTDEKPVTFVSMPSVAGEGKGIIRPETKTYLEVKKGYTYFEEGDVIFAKITPCMQNGKHAVARGLLNGFALGSTEFHVIRPCEEVTAEWVHNFLIRPKLLKEATDHFTGSVGQQRVPDSFLRGLLIPLPPLPEQKRIADLLSAQLAAVEKAREAAQAQLDLIKNLITSLLVESLADPLTKTVSLTDCLIEVKKGIGARWQDYPLIGVSRTGVSLPKEGLGKTPERYKLVSAGTIFYNPMRILLGSIGMIDEGDQAGIASPDYVIFNTKAGALHPRWFYYWLRSRYGDDFIKSMARGAVRERMLFNRLCEGKVAIPSWEVQAKIADCLINVNILTQRIKQQLETIEPLPATLLREAFSGRV